MVPLGRLFFGGLSVDFDLVEFHRGRGVDGLFLAEWLRTCEKGPVSGVPSGGVPRYAVPAGHARGLSKAAEKWAMVLAKARSAEGPW